MSFQESIKIIPQGDVAIVEFDMVGEKVNKWNTPMMVRLKEVLGELKKSTYKAAIFVSKKPKIFVAGADIDEIKTLNTREQILKAVDQGQSIFNELEDLPMPTIAAVHGACAGGGCEFLMACDYRIATEDKSTRIGLPETKLGIIPGFGGCVRMPRMIGLQAALDVILAGKLVDGKKAEKIGLVDQVVHPGLLMEVALKKAKEVIESGGKKRKKTFKAQGAVNGILESFVGRGMVYSQAKKGVLKLTHGHYPAPLKAIEVISKTYGMSDRNRAMEIEREGFCEVALTDVSKNLIHVFYLTEMVKKNSGVANTSVKAKDVKALGILGAGTMGGGIAYVAADKGIDSRMKDINFDAVGKGLKHARDLWSKEMKKRKINEFEFKQKMSLVSGTTDYSGFGNMDVVVEAIVENMDIKKKVIAETAGQMRKDAIIATNTSSLSVTEMGEAHPRPEYFAGMHFFNPVHKMPLVEVIRGPKTSDETIATIYELSKKMGKMPVVVKDGPGFLVNRLLLPYMAEAAFLMQEGQSIEAIDKAFVKQFGMPMGPIALMDEVGLDVCVKVLKIFKKALGERVEIPAIFDKMEKSDRMGKKNLKGFYKYASDGKRLEVDQSVYSEMGLSNPTNPLSDKECIERGVFAMVNECALALIEDRIVETPHEVDLAMIMGTGFPPFRGGLLKYADTLGTQFIVDQLEVYAAKKAPRLKPSQPLKNLAKNSRRFYQ
ncbi:MAG: 3-hydroxyacyl-CoA dehydrogenase NAD-binding domain-containing protein [Proteobacteria bacterium]|jgi:3-hydroxyacyl-CoA dehydrogenase/enoyl-CoA hydratase/3-hydroxybutyryl-CoA epimerase|nr:3-hydroxyacyl-CoA dehydrogenase NAD-binding domain-containing protein [Pseudomonadota bacterium]